MKFIISNRFFKLIKERIPETHHVFGSNQYKLVVAVDEAEMKDFLINNKIPFIYDYVGYRYYSPNVACIDRPSFKSVLSLTDYELTLLNSLKLLDNV